MRWPEEPFLNVLPQGQYRATKSNWLGYIQLPEYKNVALTAERKERKEYLEKIIKLGKIKPLTIYGKVIIDDDYDGYSIILCPSRKSIDELYASLEVEQKKSKKKTYILLAIIAVLIVLGIIFWKYTIVIAALIGICLALFSKR